MKYCAYGPFYLEIYLVKTMTQSATNRQAKMCIGHLKCGNMYNDNNLTLTPSAIKKFLNFVYFKNEKKLHDFIEVD